MTPRGITKPRDELWKLRAERAEATVEQLRTRLRAIQGEIKTPDVILWTCPECQTFTFGPSWICPNHMDSEAVPVRMRQVEADDHA